jgi:nitrite reductase/ring-hydroxylating ferredoxin subunit
MASSGLIHWRTVALSEQVTENKPFAVSSGGTDFVLFRNPQGVCQALVDQCAHRRAPLSLGRVTDDGFIECPYHGWRYEGASGQCKIIPNLRADEKIPNSYRVNAFQAKEQDGFISILTGDRGEPPQAPDLSLPRLDSGWSGERCIAYPGELFIDTLVDCPGALLKVTGVEIINDHRFGDPIKTSDGVIVEYAGYDASAPPSIEHPPSDFPYSLNIQTFGDVARIEVFSAAALSAAAIIAPVLQNQRVVNVLWRGVSNAQNGSARRIEPRLHMNAAALAKSGVYVSRMRSKSGEAP